MTNKYGAFTGRRVDPADRRALLDLRRLIEENAGLIGSGGSDHGALTGLGDDDHTQYAKKASNLADLTSVSDARTSLDVYSKSQVDALVGMSDVVDDTSPQLGGHLDVNSFQIMSAAGDVELAAATNLVGSGVNVDLSASDTITLSATDNVNIHVRDWLYYGNASNPDIAQQTAVTLSLVDGFAQDVVIGTRGVWFVIVSADSGGARWAGIVARDEAADTAVINELMRVDGNGGEVLTVTWPTSGSQRLSVQVDGHSADYNVLALGSF